MTLTTQQQAYYLSHLSKLAGQVLCNATILSMQAAKTTSTNVSNFEDDTLAMLDRISDIIIELASLAAKVQEQRP